MRPLELNIKTGVIGIIVAITALIVFLMKWDDIFEWLRHEGEWLNWRFVMVLLLVDAFIVGLFFHELWKKEFYQ